MGARADSDTRFPAGRLLLVLALLIAGGLGFLRADAILAPGEARSAPASAEEARLIHLIEPMTGERAVRASIQRDASGRSLLLMVDGTRNEAAALEDEVRGLLTSAGLLDADADRFTLRVFPFAASTPALSTRALAELSGYGALILILFAALLRRSEQAAAPAPVFEAARQPDRHPAAPAPDFSTVDKTEPRAIGEAARLADERPEDAAALIRRWMGPDADKGTLQ